MKPARPSRPTPSYRSLGLKTHLSQKWVAPTIHLVASLLHETIKRRRRRRKLSPFLCLKNSQTLLSERNLGGPLLLVQLELAPRRIGTHDTTTNSRREGPSTGEHPRTKSLLSLRLAIPPLRPKLLRGTSRLAVRKPEIRAIGSSRLQTSPGLEETPLGGETIVGMHPTASSTPFGIGPCPIYHLARRRPSTMSSLESESHASTAVLVDCWRVHLPANQKIHLARPAQTVSRGARQLRIATKTCDLSLL